MIMAGQLTFDNGATGSAQSEKMRITSSGNVGIGTTSPVSPLTVKSNSVSSGESGIVIQANGNTNSIIKLGERATDGGRFEMLDANVTKIALYTDGTSNYINAGNVGIGTTAPTTKLNVSGSIAVSSGSYLSFIDSNLNYNKIGRNTSVGGIQITTGGNATMNLLDNGNVGIGTTSPSSKLQVSGDAYVTGQFGQGVTVANKIAAYGGEFRSSGASAQIFFGRSGSSVGSGAIGADSTYVFKVWTMPGFGNPFVIKQDGNVGIGTTSPGTKLQVGTGIGSYRRHSLSNSCRWFSNIRYSNTFRSNSIRKTCVWR